MNIHPLACRSWRLPGFTLAFSIAVTCFAPVSHAGDSTNFNPALVFQELNSPETSAEAPPELATPWWDRYVQQSLRNRETIALDLHSLLFIALTYSNDIKVAKRDPLIRETGIAEADSTFDWVNYFDATWTDTSEPVGNQLTAGGTTDRFRENVTQVRGGLRRVNRYGGQLDISQQFGLQDNNSLFLQPADQATGQFSISYTHPLRRGSGRTFNESVVFLAQLDAEVAQQQFLATLRDELFEITDAYWDLYRERATLTHHLRLYLRTKRIHDTLAARRHIDRQTTQLVTAQRALADRKADLVRMRTSVTNTETTLRGMINAPALMTSNELELIPMEIPTTTFYPTSNQSEIQNALLNRTEVQAAAKEVQLATRRMGVAQNELQPVLNLVTSAFASGLRGNRRFGDAFTDQFSTGRPSYSIGIQYEMPIGNRLARARVCRRQHELARVRDEYARALQIIQTEVDIAVREVNTTFVEIITKSQALKAAESEATTIEARWNHAAGGIGTAALNLESLLRAQERVRDSERDYVEAVVGYNRALVNLKRSTGSLLSSEQVTQHRVCEGGCSGIQLHKGNPAQVPE